MTRDARIGILQAVAATGFFSSGAILVRWAQDLSPVEVTSLRLLLGGLMVAAAAWGSGERVALAGGELRRLIPIGLIAAVHFLTFIGSLYFTSVAHSLTLVYTAPLFIAALSRTILRLTLVYTAPLFISALSRAILRERLPRRALLGIAVGLIGVAVLAGFEPRLAGRMLLGDLLAVGAAVAFALYSLYGRRERGRIPLLTYASWVYLIAGAATAPFAVGLLARPVNGGALASIFAMALLPSALGHTLYNAALRRLHPSIPNLIAAQEVTGSILLAWLLLHEVPGWNAVAGAGI
ncbi:MAG: DMT family transporter, partial [candidate division NC10 bacterium]|nr:DMT family transporter [candidate division NC10 bacterium]